VTAAAGPTGTGKTPLREIETATEPEGMLRLWWKVLTRQEFSEAPPDLGLDHWSTGLLVVAAVAALYFGIRLAGRGPSRLKAAVSLAAMGSIVLWALIALARRLSGLEALPAAGPGLAQYYLLMGGLTVTGLALFTLAYGLQALNPQRYGAAAISAFAAGCLAYLASLVLEAPPGVAADRIGWPWSAGAFVVVLATASMLVWLHDSLGNLALPVLAGAVAVTLLAAAGVTISTQGFGRANGAFLLVGAAGWYAASRFKGSRMVMSPRYIGVQIWMTSCVAHLAFASAITHPPL